MKTPTSSGKGYTMYRHDAPQRFFCTRCQLVAPYKAEKHAKNVAERDSDGATICNGCYGWLLQQP